MIGALPGHKSPPLRSRGKADDTVPPGNESVARSLEELADLLESQDAGPFRVRAYRAAAGVVRSLERPVRDTLNEEGLAGLTRLPKIGRSLACTIRQLTATGTCPLLAQLRGHADPERELSTVPGLGPALSSRVHEELGIETLADLEAAAWDGRLSKVAGFGPRRVKGVRQTLGNRFAERRPTARRDPEPWPDQPPVAELLSIDAAYRSRSAAGRLPRIAPHRFNPSHEVWLPILHASRGRRHYTALYSNTARAHRLGTTHDWVVIYRDDAGGDGQWTVITAPLGPMRGRRIVRGREAECAGYYSADERSPSESGRATALQTSTEVGPWTKKQNPSATRGSSPFIRAWGASRSRLAGSSSSCCGPAGSTRSTPQTSSRSRASR